MQFLKKLGISLNAQMESFADKVENHEAVADSLIRQTEKNASRARVQLARVRADVSRLALRRKELQNDEQLWIERTRKVYGTDESKALECVKRIKNIRDELERVELQINDVEAVNKKLLQNQVQIDERLNELRRKRNLLACRQSCSDALGVSDSQGNSFKNEIEGVFDRWEMVVTEKEIRSDNEIVQGDTLDQEFSQDEQAVDLKVLLETIVDSKSREKE